MAQEEDALEATLGYANFTEGDEKLGWLTNVCAVRRMWMRMREPPPPSLSFHAAIRTYTHVYARERHTPSPHTRMP
jgi:hypothetical protein